MFFDGKNYKYVLLRNLNYVIFKKTIYKGEKVNILSNLLNAMLVSCIKFFLSLMPLTSKNYSIYTLHANKILNRKS